VPVGKKKSPVYAYFVIEYNDPGGVIVDPAHYICIHADHKGLPVRVAHCNMTTNLNRHLLQKHGIKLMRNSTACDADSSAGAAPSGTEQTSLPMYFKSHMPRFSSAHPQQQSFNERQLDMVISTLSPESIVDDEAYVSMIAAANPRLSVMSRRSLSRAVTTRFQCHQAGMRAALTSAGVCHANSDMWTSAANDAFGSFVVSWVDVAWELQTRVLRCGVVEGRHTALAIAAFLMQVVRDFGLSEKVGVVRTDGASNCVAAGGVLGDVAGRVAGRAGLTRILSGDRGPGATSGSRDSGGHGSAPGREVLGVHETDTVSRAPDAAGSTDWDDGEGGDGVDLPEVGSDGEDGARGVDDEQPGGGGNDAEIEAAATSRSDAFCGAMPGALADASCEADELLSSSSFLWQHARCATHTLQLSARAGLSVPPVSAVLRKVRLVSKLCRTSTNFQREMRVAVQQQEAAMAQRDIREPKEANALVSRLIIDCPTRWGSTLAMLCRFLLVGRAVPAALSAYYHYTVPTGGKVLVECPNQHELDSLSQVVTFLKVLEGASMTIGSEAVPTSPMEETIFWYVRSAGMPRVGDGEVLAALKRAVLMDMRSRRDSERRCGPNPDWFGIRVAAVLLNPFYKTSSFGGEVSTAATAAATALAVIRWMVSRTFPPTTEPPLMQREELDEPLAKRQGTFEGRMRTFLAPGVGDAGDIVGGGDGTRDVGMNSSGDVGGVLERPLEEEWRSYLSFPVDAGSDAPVLEWWRQHDKLFPRVALGAKYFLAIPATSVTSERVFSMAGRTITKLRARMTGPDAEKYIVLHDDITRRRRVERARGDME